MSDPSLHQLEQDVEAARAKLAGDLTTLRSPATYDDFTSGLKEETAHIKDALVDKAKSSVQSTIESFVQEIKGRVAANPAAALAIGTGIAWRLIKHPPIASALVGVGLYSLFRTSPAQPTWLTDEEYLTQGKQRLAEQGSEFAETVKDRAMAVANAAAEKTSEIAHSVKGHALAIGEAATEKTSELAGSAKEQALQWGAQARSSTQQMAEAAAAAIGDASSNLEQMRRSATDETARLSSRASAVANGYSRPLQDALGNQESRDSLLLGAAGIAVIAALGFAYQRRSTEPAEVD